MENFSIYARYCVYCSSNCVMIPSKNECKKAKNKFNLQVFHRKTLERQQWRTTLPCLYAEKIFEQYDYLNLMSASDGTIQNKYEV